MSDTSTNRSTDDAPSTAPAGAEATPETPASLASAPPAASPTDVGIGLNRKPIVYGAVAMLVALIGVYFPILRSMVHHWYVIEDYQHGFLIAPLALWFAYERRWDLEDAKISGSWLGLIPIFIGLTSLTIGRLGTELMTMRAAFLFTLIGFVLLLLGKEVLRTLAFPLGFLFLMVPLPQSLVNSIAFPLQLIAAKVAVVSLQELSIPALVEGNIIHLAHTELFVADACSGLRSLMALVTLGVVFAHFFKPGHLGIQFALVLATIPIAIFVNSFRVALTGYLAHHFGQEVATGAIHDFQGIFTFGLAFFFLLGLGRLIDIATDRFGTKTAAEGSLS